MRPTTATTPYWLHSVVERFWIAAGELEPFPRRLEGPVSWALPVAILKLPKLCVTDVGRQLAERGISLRPRGRDRWLHGCLVAYAGKGVIFLDGTDPDDELRFSIAHEVGHFLIDYVWPRDRAIRRLGPSIVEVLDGHRRPTVAERVDAVLAGAPIGVHTHLLDRLPSGQIGCGQIAGIEHRADRLALELLAPEGEVRQVLDVAGTPLEVAPPPAVETLLQTNFGLPPSVAHEYASFLSSLHRQRTSVRDWLGMGHTARTVRQAVNPSVELHPRRRNKR